MAKETATTAPIPETYRWDEPAAPSGIEPKRFDKELLNHLDEDCAGRVREIHQGASINVLPDNVLVAGGDGKKFART